MQEKADRFIDELLNEGADTFCDDTNDHFIMQKNDKLPPFYDENLFRKGQEFFYKNCFVIHSACLFGLISVLSVPSILEMLIHTKRSSTNMTAYRRYVATVLHLSIWYNYDFKPGSKSWKSISEVKNMHKSASKSGCKAGLNGITQKDMALTQFGFMGYQIIRNDIFNISADSVDDWKAFIHLWRVVGHLMGIEERFNICRESVEETKAICEKLVSRVFLPYIEQKNSRFLEMSGYLVHGLWSIQPILNFNAVMLFLQLLTTNNKNLNNNQFWTYKQLSFWDKCIFHLFLLVCNSLQWKFFRWIFNLTYIRDMWLIKNFPFLGYYKFGFTHGNVKILGKTE